MIDWPKLALAIVQMISSLTLWLRGESLRQEGADRARAEIQQKELEAIARANEAREEARSKSTAVPQSVSLPDDGFRRD